jgi:cytoplasmic iron level regulating protein YaaA (DUF328/UPF0246 family)
MLMVISPAKMLDFTAGPDGAPLTTAVFKDDTEILAKAARRLTSPDLRRLMGISEPLAKLNRARFQAFDPATEDGLQAVFAFNGDVYRGLAARTLDRAALRWTGDHLRILSGLYGVLRPFDAIQPYRLEMGSRLKTRRGADLYAFWGARVAEALDAEVAGHRDPLIVNLASQEYFAAVDRKALRAPVVTCHFSQLREDGRPHALGFAAKRARGLMARYIIDNRLFRREALEAFDVEGYRLDAATATATDLTFVRDAPT